MSLDLRDAVRRPVLVVEDSDDDFDTVVEAAGRAQVLSRLVRAEDADIAEGLLALSPVGHFSFMLLDYNLRGVDGLTLLQQVRSNPLLATMPAVIYTTSVNPRDRNAFYDAGANAYHVKGVQYGECLNTLENIFDYWLHRVALPGCAGLCSPARAAR